jgi:hypothetical protein
LAIAAGLSVLHHCHVDGRPVGETSPSAPNSTAYVCGSVRTTLTIVWSMARATSAGDPRLDACRDRLLQRLALNVVADNLPAGMHERTRHRQPDFPQSERSG